MYIRSLQWSMDINGDGKFSMWEMWETVRWAFQLPGNLLLEAIGQFPALATLLHVQASASTGYASLNTVPTKAITLLFWICLFLWLVSRGNKPAATAKPRTLLLPLPKDYPVTIK